MFEIEERTNLAPLLMAVLVGLLAIASPYYSRIDVRSIEAAFKPAETVEVAYVAPDSIDGLLKDLPTVDQAISSEYGLWKSNQIRIDPTPLNRALDRLKPYADRLDEIESRSSVQQQMTLLRSLFMAVEIDPIVFADAFDALCASLCDHPDPEICSQAGVLHYYRRFDLTRPNPTQLVPGLERFSSKFPDPRCGIQLHSIVAASLWKHGYTGEAQGVLKTGVKRYAGQPGVSRLVNQMVDQQVGRFPR